MSRKAKKPKGKYVIFKHSYGLFHTSDTLYLSVNGTWTKDLNQASSFRLLKQAKNTSLAIAESDDMYRVYIKGPTQIYNWY